MSETEKRKRTDYRRSRRLWITLLTVLVVLATLASLALLFVYHQLNKAYYIDYTENGKVDYRVKLKPNLFYEEEYLGAGQAYVASLIDSVEANFSYTLTMASPNVRYDYSYKIDTELLITDTKSGNTILSRVEENVAEKTFSKIGSSNLTIAEKVTLGYENYNLATQMFLEDLKLSGTKAALIVRMHINVISTCDDFENDGSNEYVVAMNIPLAAQTASIEMSTRVPTAETKILACDRAENKDVFLYAGLGTAGGDLLLIIALLLVVFLTRNTDINYSIKVKRLLSSYKSYIQQINNEFDTSGYRVLQINTFDEMLEIRDTIQSPILMHENEDQTRTQFFIPTNSSFLYLFEIKVDNYDELYAPVEPTSAPEAPAEAAPVEAAPVEEEPAPVEVAPAPVEVAEPVEAPAAAEIAEVSADDTLPEIVEVDEDGTPVYGNGPKLDYSFEAKLALSTAEVRDFYREVSDFARSYGVKVSRSWPRERIYLGRNLFALLTFKGKKLAIALALDPATHGDPKYHAFDMSDSRKFARTPMLMRITSPRKVKYAIELLTEVFTAAGLENKALPVKPVKVAAKTKKQLLEAGLIRIENEGKK